MTELAQTASLSARETLRQGLRISPELRRGIGVTLVVAVVATAGRLVIPGRTSSCAMSPWPGSRSS